MDEHPSPEHHAHALWQGQPVEPKPPSATEARAAASRFQEKIRRRNLRESIAAVVVLVVFGGYAWEATAWLARLGPVLVVLGTVYVMVQLHTKGASLAVPDAANATTCLDFHRRELGRQRDLLRRVWRWYLGPLVPGVLVMLGARLVEEWARGGLAFALAVGSVLVSAVVFLGTWWFNEAGARKLQREIDALGTT